LLQNSSNGMIIWCAAWKNSSTERERLTDFEISLNFPSIGETYFLLNALQFINKKIQKLILPCHWRYNGTEISRTKLKNHLPKS
jgi:hypothetical protein